jgi:hypothetical protein
MPIWDHASNSGAPCSHAPSEPSSAKVALMRSFALFAFLLVPACGRSGLGLHEAGTADQRPSEQADLPDGSQQTADISIDRQADQAEASQACSYNDIEDTVWRCNEDYQLVTEMSDGHDACPTYYVFQKTGQTYPLLETLLADNGCDSTCRWEPTLWEVYDRCGPTDFVVGYHSYQIKCQFNDLWYSSTTGRLYLNRDEARATLPVCPDAGI